MEDQPAFVIEVVMVGDGFANVAVLLRGARRVELLQLEPMFDGRLQQVQGANRVRHDGFVGAVPRLADMRLRAEVEHEWLVGCGAEFADEVVDGSPVGQVGEVNGHVRPEVADVVEGPA